MDTFPAIIISCMRFGDVYCLSWSHFVDLQGGLTNDEMWCVIAGENPGNVFSYEIYKW